MNGLITGQVLGALASQAGLPGSTAVSNVAVQAMVDQVEGRQTVSPERVIAAAGNQVSQAGMPAALIPAVIGGISGLAGWGISQLTGGDQTYVPVEYGGSTTVYPGETGGPGVPEPAPSRIAKQWTTKYERKDGRDGMVYFTKTIDGWIYWYNNLTGDQGKYKPSKPITTVMPRSKMSMRDFVKLEKYVNRTDRALAKASPNLKMQR